MSAKARVTRRITPADAGKTGFALKNIFADWDHPRGCGENLLPTPSASLYTGSPPRMRGKPQGAGIIPLMLRITPADAGKTRGYTYSLPQLQDHPRGCGENQEEERSMKMKRGSPPRMRGKRDFIHFRTDSTGITPADAGKTEPTDGHILRKQDHPRGCGENADPAKAVRFATGSPPRMRGKQLARAGGGCCYGITPADAGKTFVF